MAIVSIIGPKGGIGKTTLSINIAAALAGALKMEGAKNRVCLIDLDLRLPTISSILDSHPRKTFYDLFETLANKTLEHKTIHRQSGNRERRQNSRWSRQGLHLNVLAQRPFHQMI